MNKFKVITIIIIFILLTQSIFVFAIDQTPNTLILYKDLTSNEKYIFDSYNSVNSNKWDEWVSYWAPESPEKVIGTDIKYKEEKIGICSVKSANVVSINKIGSTEVYNFPYSDKYGSVEFYLVGIDIKTYKESDFFFNGINYRTVIIGEKDGKWYKLQEMCCDIGILKEMENILPTTDAINNYESRRLAMVEKTKKQDGYITLDVGISSSLVQPQYIWIFCSGTPSEYVPDPQYEYSDTPSEISMYPDEYEYAMHVPFDYFCRRVLSNEISSTYELEAQKANALAIRSYAWYYYLAPACPDNGASLDGSIHAAYWKWDSTEYYNSDRQDAYNAVCSEIMLNSDDNYFELFYNSTEGIDAYHTGCMDQNYSNELKLDNPSPSYTYENILHYFFDNSNQNAYHICGWNDPNYGSTNAVEFATVTH